MAMLQINLVGFFISSDKASISQAQLIATAPLISDLKDAKYFTNYNEPIE